MNVCLCDHNLVMWICSYFVTGVHTRTIAYVTQSEMHPGKEASAFHPEDSDEDVGDKDEEDGDG